MNSWHLRDEILIISHRWYVILVCILMGSLLGWGISSLWPSPFRAVTELYVGLNPYRSPYDNYAASLAGQAFRMVDDYKNWQMGQLNELVISDLYLEETLDRLRMQDAYWEEISAQEFRGMTEVLWRNVGKWQLVVVNEDRRRASLAVETWAALVHEKVNDAIAHSKKVVALDIQMSDLAETLTELGLREGALIYVRDELTVIVDRLNSIPQNRAVSSGDHWKMLALVSQVVEWNQVWDRVLEDAPEAGSDPDQYLDWLEKINTLINDELAILPGKVSSMDETLSLVKQEYMVETEKSAGLASTLVIDEISSEAPQIEPVRQDGMMSILGGILGILSWTLWVIFRISRKVEP